MPKGRFLKNTKEQNSSKILAGDYSPSELQPKKKLIISKVSFKYSIFIAVVCFLLMAAVIFPPLKKIFLDKTYNEDLYNDLVHNHNYIKNELEKIKLQFPIGNVSCEKILNSEGKFKIIQLSFKLKELIMLGQELSDQKEELEFLLGSKNQEIIQAIEEYRVNKLTDEQIILFLKDSVKNFENKTEQVCSNKLICWLKKVLASIIKIRKVHEVEISSNNNENIKLATILIRAHNYSESLNFLKLMEADSPSYLKAKKSLEAKANSILLLEKIIKGELEND